MAEELLSARQAAQRLGLALTTLYDWLGRSDRGRLVLRGRLVQIAYLQGGARGRGRIHLEASEVERLKDLLRVRPQSRPAQQPPRRRQTFPGITVPLGRPEPG
ncbi:MAG: DNA-binding protein [Gemmatimonadales bacterium]